MSGQEPQAFAMHYAIARIKSEQRILPFLNPQNKFMNALFIHLKNSTAQEYCGGGNGSNGTGSNAGGVRYPADISGNSDGKGNQDIYNGNGNHWGWDDGEST